MKDEIIIKGFKYISVINISKTVKIELINTKNGSIVVFNKSLALVTSEIISELFLEICFK